ncbi:MAG: glucosyl-3-phosphoglycerate synthase [Actinomycetota bacterium]|nr:glucosyl-3-phosphoglycerate synthase [Actinomycetota bacterium]MDA2972479.1 glucosyl-3-phosphoglycerate synthase [Actinomycetota bacterium]MDA3002032.1 glucosyl-3-phosphoglycerate synthase [Actinomycetota bacterium]
MSRIKTFDPSGWNLETALAAKGDRSVSVCIPCRNEAETIGDLVRMIDQSLLGSLVDEMIVLDDGSTDGTADIAEEAGATVVPVDVVHFFHGSARGKGNALWSSLVASNGDFVVWCDGDITSLTPEWIVRLVMPLLIDDELGLVKASYQRPSHLGGGGRTTELVARPLLSLFFPELAELQQPLAGEYAGRRSMLESIPFATGWGVEIGMIVDMFEKFGVNSLGQVDLGMRLHRHHRLETLAIQAAEVTATLLSRLPDAPSFAEVTPRLVRKVGDPIELNLMVRPPVSSLSRFGVS